MYGGIHEVTKELDDMIVFDFKNTRWIQFFEELISPVKKSMSSARSIKKQETVSPGMKNSPGLNRASIL